MKYRDIPTLCPICKGKMPAEIVECVRCGKCFCSRGCCNKHQAETDRAMGAEIARAKKAGEIVE